MKMRIDYYLDADQEPTIRIDTGSVEAIRTLINVCHGLASGKLTEIEFKRIDGLQIVGSISLWLIRSEAKRERRKTFQRKNVGESVEFIWILTPEGWDDCVSWLEGLIQTPDPGHQYLTDGPDDDAQIIIGFRELSID